MDNGNQGKEWIAQTSNQLVLEDGRQLGWAEYGDPQGYPLVALHGTPGSRLWFQKADPAILELGVRFISVDRPGYGLSDPKPGRSILDFAEDIRQLTQQLDLKQIAIMGISGGGVFAAACAHQLPGIIQKAGLIATINEFENGRPPRETCRPNRISFMLAKRLPWLLRFAFRQQQKMMLHRPEIYLKGIQANVSHLCPSDQQVSAQKENAGWMLMHMREAFRNGVGEPVRELRLLSGPWGFDPEEIQCPMEIWHGTADTLAPINGIKPLADALPNCRPHFLPDKGHFLDDDPDIWRAILISLMP